MITSAQNLRDGHIWISIFYKQASNTFTRVQRLTCCLTLLLTTMLTNLMFYGIPTDDPEDQLVTGGFKLSLSQIVIGLYHKMLKTVAANAFSPQGIVNSFLYKILYHYKCTNCHEKNSFGSLPLSNFLDAIKVHQN
jgi:hypothetical protein